jgi:hypothetical protein
VDINGLGSGSLYKAPTAPAKAPLSFDDVKTRDDGMMLSLLPPLSPSPSFSSGLGGNLDIYAAVGMQAQGLVSGGRTAIEAANASLGIDMSLKFTAGTEDASGADGSGESPSGTDGASKDAAGAPQTASETKSPSDPLDEILKADGFKPAPADPYVLKKDFFADSENPPESSPTRYFTSPDLSNPSLGGLLNSIG